jgi:hypothetical protein
MYKKNKKRYFHAEEYQSWSLSGIRFVGQDWTVGYWAGGNEHKAKFILQQLTQDYWLDSGIKIYNAYNDALLAVSKDKQRNNKKAVLVFYERVNDNKGSTMTRAVQESEIDVHSWEQRLWEETTSS